MSHQKKIRKLFALLGVATFFELQEAYSKIDQELFLSRTWNYGDQSIIINQVRVALEEIDPNRLNDEDRQWRAELIWFWYHHAISCALWRRDMHKAREFSEKALISQWGGDDHPNKITRLLYYLVHDQMKEAEKWASKITTEDAQVALETIQDYKVGKFSAPQD